MRRGAPLAPAVVLVLLLSACGSTSGVFALRANDTASTSASASASTSTSGAVQSTTTLSPPATHDALLPEVEAAAAIHPVRVAIARLGVNAEVVAVGLDSTTLELDVPDGVTQVAWYRNGSVPGAPGGALLAAHVDFNGRKGLFFALDQLAAGDMVAVQMSDGTTQSFAVSSVQRSAKDALRPDELIGADGAPRLSLVTCGGHFDATTRHYEDNVIVTAQPIGTTSTPR